MASFFLVYFAKFRVLKRFQYRRKKKNLFRMSSSKEEEEEEEEEKVVEIVPTLKNILDVLTSLQERVKKVLAFERRSRREESQEVADLLQKVRHKLEGASGTLEEVEDGQSEGKKKEKKKENRKRVRREEEGENVHQQGGREKRAVWRGNRKEEQDEEKPRSKKLQDGGPCLVVVSEKETLVYFALANECDDKKSFECPLLSEKEGTLVVERKTLQPVEFALLSEEVKPFYLSQLESDIVRRFEINVPVLFKDHGGAMLKTMRVLNGDPSQERIGSLFDSLSKDTIASKNLSAASNTVLMLAAKLHAMLSEAKEDGWYALFKRQIAEFCKNCWMKVSTVERYQGAGALMLKSKVLACMLPSFVALNMGAMEQLLNDEEVVERWETLFEEKTEVLELENGDEGREMMEIEGREGVGVDDAAKSPFNENDVVAGEEQQQQTTSSSPFNENMEELCLGEEDLASRQPVNDDGPEDFLHLMDGPCDRIDRVAPEVESVGKDKEEKELVEDDEREQEECNKCGLVGLCVFLACDGPGKKHYFCWQCNGYSAAPPPELVYPGARENSICTVVFCKKHVEELEDCQVPYKSHVQRKNDQQPLSIQDFVNRVQADEAQHIVRIFSADECEYSLMPIKRNGWCIFESVVAILKLDLAEFVKKMKKFAGDYFKEEANTAFLTKPQLCRGLWNRLNLKEKTSIDAFRSTEAADLLIPMIAEYLNLEKSNLVKICAWSVENGELVKSPYEYPKEQVGEVGVTINLFKSNLFVEHFDLIWNVLQVVESS
jgi:hypothetical protein